MPQTYRTRLKYLGWSLILLGLLAIAMMLYRGAAGLNAISNILSLGVVVGVFLIRGNLQITVWVTRFAAFYWMYCVASTIILMTMSSPLALWMTRFRLQPMFMAASFLFTGMVAVYLPWLYCQLRHPQIVTACGRTEVGAAPPIGAWVGGAGLGVILSTILYLSVSSPDGAEALQRAEQQLGPDYNYRLTSIFWSGSQVEATVTAYSRTTIQSIDVEWTK
ncbi:hypothetical protein ACSYAD_00085 [Acaryochloris marina NIES-2412]|uniref:hypothetical protein n=1 Tax=Acaryochloris marina TaxID=155978 RepID=UPI004059B156